MFPRKRVSSNNNSSKDESGTREERLPGLHQTHAKSEPSSRMLGNNQVEASGTRGPRPASVGEDLVPSRPGLGLSAVPVPSHFSLPESASTAQGGTGKRRGAARAPPRAPLGGRTERRSSQRPGLGANRGSRAGSTRAPRPGHPRGSRRRTPRAAAPLAPRLARTSPRLGTLQLGGRAGRAREFPGRPGARRGGRLSPGSVSPAPPVGLPGLRRLHGPRTQAVPGRLGVRSASSARSPGRDRHSPRPPRLRAADPRRSLLPGLAVPCGRARPRAVRTGGLGPARPPPAPRSPSPPEFGALLQCLRG